MIVGDRVTLGYASCFGPPAAFLALARRGLPPIVRLRRTFPTTSMVGRDGQRSVVFNTRPSLMQPVCKLPPVVRLRRTFPACSRAGRLIAGLMVFKKNRAIGRAHNNTGHPSSAWGRLGIAGRSNPGLHRPRRGANNFGVHDFAPSLERERSLLTRRIVEVVE